MQQPLDQQLHQQPGIVPHEEEEAGRGAGQQLTVANAVCVGDLVVIVGLAYPTTIGR